MCALARKAQESNLPKWPLSSHAEGSAGHPSLPHDLLRAQTTVALLLPHESGGCGELPAHRSRSGRLQSQSHDRPLHAGHQRAAADPLHGQVRAVEVQAAGLGDGAVRHLPGESRRGRPHGDQEGLGDPGARGGAWAVPRGSLQQGGGPGCLCARASACSRCARGWSPYRPIMRGTELAFKHGIPHFPKIDIVIGAPIEMPGPEVPRSPKEARVVTERVREALEALLATPVER